MKFIVSRKRFLVAMLLAMTVTIIGGIVFADEPAAPPAPAAAAATAAPAAPAPKIDTGDTAWMIVATALVMLMSIPGLALFYGGLAKSKDSLNTMAMTFVTFCIVSVLWVIYGYPLSFGADIGGSSASAEKMFLKGVGPNSISDLAKTIPEYIFIVYQLTFAAITVALASGAYIERMKFSAWVLFSMHLDDAGLSPGRPLGLGRRVPGQDGRAGFRRRNGRACQCRYRGACGRPGPRQAACKSDHARQSYPGDHRRWSPLVRVVRVQCGLGARGERPGRRGIHQHEHGSGGCGAGLDVR